MQEFTALNEQDQISKAIPYMQKSIESAASNFSGTSFPTTNLKVGMMCMRTDDSNTIYKLTSDNPITWESVGVNASTASKSDTATKLETARNFVITGSATSGTVTFDGTKNVSLEVDKITASSVTDELRDSLMEYAKSALKKYFFGVYHPVGCIYESTTSTNPADIWGVGTWESYGVGRVTIGAGTADSGTTYTAGDTGGEEKHANTANEIPFHNHSFSGTTSTNGEHTHGVKGVDRYDEASGDEKGFKYLHSKSVVGPYIDTTSAGNHSHSFSGTTGNTGGGQAHNNMQPYIVVYRWHRKE